MKRNGWLDWPCLVYAVCALAGMVGLGCSHNVHNAPVDASKAREALRTALDSWKQGDAVEALQSADTPIYVIDMDWQAGVKLMDYQIVNDGQEKDAQLYCPVKLTLRSSVQREVQKEVIFIVATAPNVVVSRKVF